MTQSLPLQLILRTDGRFLTPGLPEARTLLLDVICAPQAQNAPRSPLAVMLALDVSGSMAGAKLTAVREACARVLAGLDSRDLLGICAFDEAASIRLPLTAMDAAGRTAAVIAIQGLREGGSTALCDGWRLAADALLADDPRFASRSLHVVVLSDGMGNVGVTEPDALAEFAASISLRGISTSAIGVGDDWSSEQLEALAMSGGGRLHHAIAPQELTALLEGEIHGMQRLGAVSSEASFAVPAGFRIQVLSPERLQFADGVLRIRLGALQAGARRSLAVRLIAEDGAGSGPWAVEAALIAQHPETRGDLLPLHATLRLDRAASDAEARAARDEAVVLEVAEQWAADFTRRVMMMNRSGVADRQASVAEAAAFGAYCRGAAGTEEMVLTISRLAEQAERDWSESTRKLTQMAAFKQSRSEGVHAHRASLMHSVQEALDEEGGTPRTR